LNLSYDVTVSRHYLESTAAMAAASAAAHAAAHAARTASESSAEASAVSHKPEPETRTP